MFKLNPPVKYSSEEFVGLLRQFMLIEVIPLLVLFCFVSLEIQLPGHAVGSVFSFIGEIFNNIFLSFWSI